MEIQVQEVDAATVARALEAGGVSDPRHVNTPADLAAGGSCMRMVTKDGSSAFVLRKQGAVMWVDGAASEGGTGMAPVGLELAKSIAKQAGCTSVAFETDRPGLAKLAVKQGYRITGFILESAV